MERLLKKYNVKIREFEIDFGKSKVVCRDVIPMDELLEKIEKSDVTVYLYNNFFEIGNLTIYSSQDFLLQNFDKIVYISKLLNERKVFFYGKDLDLLSFIIKHTSVKELRIIEKDGWVVINNLVYNLSCGESGLITLLMYLHELFRPLIIGNCNLIYYASYFINRGIVAILNDRVYVDGNLISPPDVNLLSFISSKFLKNRYEIKEPKLDVISKIREFEEKYEARKIVINGSSVEIW
ncbi:hypothetical protein SJAV_21150 [Sulfurisphaera javensis]|uniref:Uncharacterized protein n=1 Tax=Sulfurisphaera javensis TaxID=2049879 RepID=A0AAT9GTH5_9CREN